MREAKMFRASRINLSRVINLHLTPKKFTPYKTLIFNSSQPPKRKPLSTLSPPQRYQIRDRISRAHFIEHENTTTLIFWYICSRILTKT